MEKTPIPRPPIPIAGTADGSIISGNPQIVNYTKEVLRNPLDSKDTTARSAISMLPEEEQFIVESHYNRSTKLFSLSERSLLTEMRHAGFEPSSTENLLRNKFWLEYDHATMGDYGKIRVTEVIRGICSFKFFRETFLANQYMVAFLMLPPINFKTKQEETLLFGLDKLRAVLDLPTTHPDGSININVVKAQMGVYQILERRVQGEVVQKTMTAHAYLPLSPSSREEVDALSEEQMLVKMQELVDKQKSRASTKAALSDIFITVGKPYVSEK
jgi:hypothetical protein